MPHNQIPVGICSWRQVHSRKRGRILIGVGLPMPQTVVVCDGVQCAFIVKSHTLDLDIAKAVLLDEKRFFLQVVGIQERDALDG